MFTNCHLMFQGFSVRHHSFVRMARSMNVLLAHHLTVTSSASNKPFIHATVLPLTDHSSALIMALLPAPRRPDSRLFTWEKKSYVDNTFSYVDNACSELASTNTVIYSKL